MANFAPGGFSTGFARGAAVRQGKQLRELEQQRMQQEQAQAQAQQFWDNRQGLVERTIETFDQIVTHAADAARSGRATEDQIAQIQQGALVPIQVMLQTLQNDIAIEMSKGQSADPNKIQQLQTIGQMLQSHAGTFDSAVTAAQSQATPPEVLGRDQASVEASRIRGLSEEFGLSEEDVMERIGLAPDRPAPSELQILERELQMLRDEGVEEEDPRVQNRLARIHSAVTPSQADVVVPILRKMLEVGREGMTKAEIEVLDTVQRLSFFESLMRTTLGGSPTGSPSYNPETGEIN